jgi:iron-sulfur cluster assembly protein
MLTITPDASQAIRGLLDQEEVPEGSIVRIRPEPEKGLEIGLARAPEPEDQIVKGDGIEICVEQSAADVLDDKELDAGTVNGNVAFRIAPQDGVVSD